MSHEIETMAFYQDTPWHGLGTALQEDDLYDWKKTCEKAGLAWDVELVPLVTADTQATVRHRAVRRNSDGRILGEVGPRFFVLQKGMPLLGSSPSSMSRKPLCTPLAACATAAASGFSQS